MDDSNTLMFKIGIADVKAELDKHKKEIDSWVNANPIKLKVQFEDSALDQLAAKLKAMGATFGEDNAEIKKLKTELASLKKDLEAALNVSNAKASGSAISSVTTETKNLGETAKQSGQEQAEAIKTNMRLAENYKNLLYKIESQMRATWQASRGFAKEGSGPNPLYNEYKELALLRRDVRSMIGSEDKENLSFLSAKFQRIKSEYKDLMATGNSLNKKREQVTDTTRNLSAEEDRLSQAMRRSTSEMHSQSQILSDLKQYALQYLSVWGASNFVDKIIQTGGQLEQQRLSLSAILGDMEKANTLFGQVKELALKSPFGVVQIDQMTKQLAAYSFEYEELFDWTKRLADISAATGTSVDRLALALGHVRSEGALSGYTLRQFAMANVPVLKMLSQNLGISTKEVRERVRKKEIGAEDVQNILKQLTDEGGMFYNAQEVMSQALNARFKNLRDAFDIMYGEIAEGGVGDALKELANILIKGAKEWERFGKDILMLATAFGIGKTAIYLYNTALGENTISTLKSISAAQNKENAYLRLARAAGLVTKAEYEQLVYNEEYSVSNIKVALATEKMTIAELQRAVALGKVKKQIAEAAVVQAGYDATLIGSVKVLGFWRKGIFLIGEGFRTAGAAAMGFLKAIWPLLALSALFDLINKTSQQNDAAEEAAVGAAKATNKYQDLQSMTERLGKSQNKTNDELENNIKAMKEALIAVGEYTEELEKEVDSVETLAEKYEILHAAMKKVSDKGNDKQERKQALIQEGLSVGGGTAWNPLNWFRDNALQDAKDIDDYTQKLNLAFDKNDKVLREGMKKILSSYKQWKKEYESMSARDIFMSLSDSQQNDVLYNLRWMTDSKATEKAGKSIASVLLGGSTRTDASGYSLRGAYEELRGHKEELAKYFADAFNVDYPDIDLSKADDTQKVIFAKWLDTTIANLEDVKEAGKKALNDIVIEGTINVRPKYSLDNENWEKFLSEFKEKNPLAYYEWNKHENAGALTEEEKRKSLQSYGKTFGGITSSNLGNSSKKQLAELKKERVRLRKERKSQAYKEDLVEKQRVDDRLAQIDKEERRLKNAQKDYNQYGDPDKKGNKEDKEAKKLRERVRILKEAADSYQYWRKKVGETKAETHMLDEFGEILKEQNLTIKNSDELRAKLKELRDEYSKKPQTKAMVEAIKEIDKELAKLDRKDFEKSTEEWISKLSRDMDEFTKKWEIFNSVVSDTGDRMLAARISGISPGATSADLKRMVVESTAGVNIDFDKILGMSDKQIEEYVYTLGLAEEKIEAVQNGLKEWNKTQQDLTKSDIENYAKWLGSLVDYQTILNKKQEEFKKTVEETQRLVDQGLITDSEAGRRTGAAAVKFNNDMWQTQAAYKNLYNNALGMASDEFANAYAKEIEQLDKMFAAGLISIEDYTEKVKKLNQIQQEFSNQGFLGIGGGVGAYLSGGYQGLIGYHRNRANAKWEEYNQAVNLYGKDSIAAYNAQKEAEDEEERVDAMEKAQKAAEQLAQTFNDLASGADLVANMFDALGMEGAATAFGDAAGVLGGIGQGAQSLSVLGPWGMAAGGILGGITSIAQLNDKNHERRIQELKREVTKIDNTLNTIKSLRERELGYDRGTLRSQLVSLYKAQERNISLFGSKMSLTPAQSGMVEYYGRYSGGNGYSQEYNALVETRKKYMEMYDEENAKKKKSQEALEEYKVKIAELDEEIMYFVQDLAKDLWSIDIQGWANQISDALWTAFENGEDAVKAFGDTAKDIISSVAKNMMSLHVIEPVFKKLENALFGEGGAIKYDSNGNIDMYASEQPVLEILGEFFGSGGEMEKSVEAAEMFYNWVEKITGMDLSSDENKTGASSSIKNITESTADLLASYLNAVRLDVSVMRAIQGEYFPLFLQAILASNTSLTNIENNTAAIVRSNDIIANKIKAIDDRFRGLENKTWKVPIA